MSILTWVGIAVYLAIETTEQCLLRTTSRSKSRWPWRLALAIGLYLTGLWIWYWLLTQQQIGVLLPLMGANYVAVLLAGRVFFSERITMRKAMGIALISIGFAFVAAQVR